MKKSVNIALAQLDLRVGDVMGNTEKILDYTTRARDALQADLVVFSELAICGYPPEDLLFQSGLLHRIDEALDTIYKTVRGIAILVGFPEYSNDKIYNACAVLRDGEILARYRKCLLPNYRVFDEERYFTAGKEASVFLLNGIRIGLNICEDIWQPAPVAAAKVAGAEFIIAINGSPYEPGSQSKREDVVRQRVQETRLPIAYLNMVGGQDELVFDGGSFVMDTMGEIAFRAKPFSEGLYRVEMKATAMGVIPQPCDVEPCLSEVRSVYEALVVGTRSYVEKNGFPGVILGLSGGVDSALILAIACDAIGAERVSSVMMPFRYTSIMSQEDAATEAAGLGVQYEIIPIEPIFEATINQLARIFEGHKEDVTEENIQARCRGMLLMAISNKTGRMLLTTGNKSEIAIGYATLYGDMAGGFAPIKDCSKSLVYRLARYRNTISQVIPERVLTRPPSAELKANQKDSDSLPEYDILDPILEAFIEDDLSVNEITELGFDKDVVIQVVKLVQRSEYKRRQAPPGIRISSRAFGRDWRYPITSGYQFLE
jgi:NAD+ synthase (glutamine-hydrolysing)